VPPWLSRKLGYTGNGQYLVYRDVICRTTEYWLRLDRPAWQASRDGTPCTITGLAPCLAMFGLGTTPAGTEAPVPAT
jgi:hypothetical protein